MNLFTSILAFLLTIGFIVFFIYFGLIFIAIAFACSVLLWIFITLRVYWLRLFHKNLDIKTNQENTTQPINRATIIDVEYHDITDKNKE